MMKGFDKLKFTIPLVTKCFTAIFSVQIQKCRSKLKISQKCLEIILYVDIVSSIDIVSIDIDILI